MPGNGSGMLLVYLAICFASAGVAVAAAWSSLGVLAFLLAPFAASGCVLAAAVLKAWAAEAHAVGRRGHMGHAARG